MPDVRDTADSPEVARQRCLDFASMHSEVPVYAAIVAGMADDPDAIDLLCRAAPGQARPVLLLAALHDLAMRRPDSPAAHWFSPRARPAQDPWPDVRRAITEFHDELSQMVATRTTQTNEVNRSTYVRAMVARACADLPDTSITLLELGASAGFLLNIEHYRVAVGDVAFGPLHARVRCEAENLGSAVELRIPPIARRIGLDADPIGPDDIDDLRWLRACIWPEMPGRVERFDAAVEGLRDHPPTLVRGDMVDALPGVIERGDDHLVVFSSWAVTYLPRERRPLIARTLDDVASARPVSWVTAEPPGCVPGLPDVRDDHADADRLTGTHVGLRRWRDDAEIAPELLGTVHPHGNSINFR